MKLAFVRLKWQRLGYCQVAKAMYSSILRQNFIIAKSPMNTEFDVFSGNASNRGSANHLEVRW
ncbi:hypothetical protein [Pseudomonas fluorescens]|uniref:Uncharacterized protein n=1 Tax=Pseudomonas fluorescens TaxID=294 RepID=A0A944DI45_PSEFL|nr:hypothetical protein [Pseudomonas fluorescens]MBT2298478.1 hypothetical protein [Pseudomonas fluorescens]MBT2311027.1 hypothetical protein [Pseudomonas fluorescens]MBT2320038.1 hypothetical protein [Pseudomonas fluorescens]MBT2328934.1 hypothetical protein [Pseudomonas fluorescens]MBT2346308.1 hypothetical protein [Pseudomonas fluorescens]